MVPEETLVYMAGVCGIHPCTAASDLVIYSVLWYQCPFRLPCTAASDLVIYI